MKKPAFMPKAPAAAKKGLPEAKFGGGKKAAPGKASPFPAKLFAKKK
jgi:hypothetical protein